MSLSLDGSNIGTNSSATSLGVTLTTAAGSGVIVAVSAINPSEFVSITAPGLTFSQRTSASQIGGGSIQIYTAPYTSNFSNTITLTAASATLCTLVVFGVGGAATSNYFDPNISAPVTNTVVASDTTAINTSNANDFLYVVANPDGDNAVLTDTDSQTWTNIIWNGSTEFVGVSYRIVSSTKSSFVVNESFNNSDNTIDAIIQASSGGGSVLSAGTFSMMGVGHHKKFGCNPLTDRSRIWRRRPSGLWF